MPPGEGSEVGWSRIPAERSKGIFLVQRLAASLEAVHFALVDLQFAFLFQAAAQIAHKQFHRLLTLLLGKLLANVVAVGGKLCVREGGLLAAGHLQYHILRSQVQGLADLSWLQIKSGAKRSSHGSQVGYL